VNIERTRRRPTKATCSLRAWISIAGALLSLSIFGASSASASLPIEEVTGAAESVVSSVVTSVPSPPSDAPTVPVAPTLPATPTVSAPAVPAPSAAEGSTAPQAPVHKAPVEVPTPVTPTSSQAPHVAPQPAGGAGKVPRVASALPPRGETASPATVPGAKVASTEMGQGAPSPVRAAADAGADRPPGVAARPIRAAPLPLWFVHIWPAVALGRAGRLLATLATLLARWEDATSRAGPSHAIPVASQPGGIAGEGEVLGLSKRSASRDEPLATSPLVTPPVDGGMSLFLTIITSLVALVGLMALARLVLGDEPFTSLRWPR
jgi:hypothetical protein